MRGVDEIGEARRRQPLGLVDPIGEAGAERGVDGADQRQENGSGIEVAAEFLGHRACDDPYGCAERNEQRWNARAEKGAETQPDEAITEQDGGIAEHDGDPERVFLGAKHQQEAADADAPHGDAPPSERRLALLVIKRIAEDDRYGHGHQTRAQHHGGQVKQGEASSGVGCLQLDPKALKIGEFSAAPQKQWGRWITSAPQNKRDG
ncbi:hypothetical protein H2O14_03900 [Rhizobium sp. G21]|nr:hypothetical protein [Rhizobium sp. G21]